MYNIRYFAVQIEINGRDVALVYTLPDLVSRLDLYRGLVARVAGREVAAVTRRVIAGLTVEATYIKKKEEENYCRLIAFRLQREPVIHF